MAGLVSIPMVKSFPQARKKFGLQRVAGLAEPAGRASADPPRFAGTRQANSGPNLSAAEDRPSAHLMLRPAGLLPSFSKAFGASLGR